MHFEAKYILVWYTRTKVNTKCVCQYPPCTDVCVCASNTTMAMAGVWFSSRGRRTGPAERQGRRRQGHISGRLDGGRSEGVRAVVSWDVKWYDEHFCWNFPGLFGGPFSEASRIDFRNVREAAEKGTWRMSGKEKCDVWPRYSGRKTGPA